jgi:hypothetical protein
MREREREREREGQREVGRASSNSQNFFILLFSKTFYYDKCFAFTCVKKTFSFRLHFFSPTEIIFRMPEAR